MRSINKQVPNALSLSSRRRPKVNDRFRATGKGWQSRINEALKKASGI